MICIFISKLSSYVRPFALWKTLESASLRGLVRGKIVEIVDAHFSAVSNWAWPLNPAQSHFFSMQGMRWPVELLITFWDSRI